MVVKEGLALVLILGCFQVFASEHTREREFSDKSSEEIKNLRYHEKQMKHGKEYKKKYEDAERQFQKDYNRWSEKKHSGEIRDKEDFQNINEIDSNEYVDKFNKYGRTFNPNLVDMRVEKETYHEKTVTEIEKPGNLHSDTNVNYINNNKQISGDSELIPEQEKSRSLLHDTDVNFVSKEILGTTKAYKSKEKYQENYQNGNEMYMKRYKKDFYQNLNKIDLSSPPPANDTVLMARYIVHTVDWAALGTISSRSPTKGAPFVCVKATSDGTKNASSGIPFFYMSPMDICTQDLQKDNRVSLLVTLSETEFCRNKNYDPQDPRCAKLTLSGKIKKIKAGSDEEKFAKEALFARHPQMASWPSDHEWYVTKLKIGQIILLDKFGGASYIKVKDYLNGGIVEPELRRK